ncbi:protein-disulfide reductase DsbD [Polynucleobacter sp. MWH-UH24A]|uniref:protein-disulfide reductase DsbD n=1 Tax=Polynucleobacter sp. MWH-UH24A TaxID=2689110 RepID=UPI001BFE7BAE|nr:protein-disulfide reductase DsbD [Polynucleobacter sp. MWH-UH24A]QWD76182.1 protein-disulfide reductase DsbD [Polynucleobacter sp. MWH-UH24A]
MRRIQYGLVQLLLFLLSSVALSGLVSAKEFLPPEKAFIVEATWLANTNEIAIEYRPVSGYYIYQESLQYRLFINDKPSAPKSIQIPRGVEKFDETFGKKMEIFLKPFEVVLGFTQTPQSGIRLEIDLQGCADGGICYPPMTYQYFIAAPGVRVAPIPEGDAAPIRSSNPTPAPFNLRDLWSGRDDVASIKSYLENAKPFYLFAGFFILGIALAFTPCVLPMLPILSSIVLGRQDGGPISKTRSAYLALAYILGMALLYALAGVLTAALGSGVQRALQSPIALILFALLLLFLAGSLFGLYELKMPQAWQNKVDQLAGRQKGGSIAGAFGLGAISTLVASPCITAPLASVLGFVAQTGSMVLGGGLLFVMALGMGLPLLLIAMGARSFLPQTGAWMMWLQRGLGLVLIALAIWIVWPVMSVVAGNQNQISPRTEKRISSDLVFQVVRSSEELERILQRAKAENKPVILDYYADWCISCKEMEAITFTNPEVAKAMSGFVLVQADVTINSQQSQALLKQFSLYGPPAILFFNGAGAEQKSLRVVGFMAPSRFLERLQELEAK